MKMKKFAALAAATVMSVSAIAATSAFGVFATTDAGVNNIVIKDSDTNRVYKAYQIFDQASATNTIKWGKGIFCQAKQAHRHLQLLHQRYHFQPLC